jgi:hypothetical protein
MRARRVGIVLVVAGAMGVSSCAAFLSDFTIGEGADGSASGDGGADAPGTDADAALGLRDVAPGDADGSQDGSSQDGTCSPLASMMYVCSDTEAGILQVTTPEEFCLASFPSDTFSAVSTPAACQCPNTFTCACLKASSYLPLEAWCASTTADAGCICVDNGSNGPLVRCGDGCIP